MHIRRFTTAALIGLSATFVAAAPIASAAPAGPQSAT